MGLLMKPPLFERLKTGLLEGIEYAKAYCADKEPRLKKNVVILGGSGRIGKAIYYGIEKLGYKPIILDIGGFDITKDEDISWTKPDCVISALPYYHNLKAAKLALACNAHYCDLGGNVTASNSIKQLSVNKCFLTDMGLAPGWINIDAEKTVLDLVNHKHAAKPKNVQLFVGGLPIDWEQNDNPAKYKLNWSFDGLYNEYTQECEVLENNEVVIKPAMSNLENYKGYQFEYFLTGGVAEHSIQFMLEHNIENFSYSTLRYKGHHKVMSWLMKHLSKTEIKKLFPLEQYRDVVYKRIKVNNWEFTSDPIYSNNGFSAMQRATAFPVCAVVDMMLKDQLPHRHLTFTDIVEQYNFFEAGLKKLELC